MVMHRARDDELICLRLRDDLLDLVVHRCWRADGGDGDHRVGLGEREDFFVLAAATVIH